MRPAALGLTCVVTVAFATAPAPGAVPGPRTPQQRIDARKIEIFNGTTREVHYDLHGLTPEHAALYRRVEHLENEATLAQDVQRLKAIYVRDAARVEAFQMGGLNYNLRPATWGGFGQGLGYGYGCALPNTTLNMAADSEYLENTLGRLQAAQRDLLVVEGENPPPPEQVKPPALPPADAGNGFSALPRQRPAMVQPALFAAPFGMTRPIPATAMPIPLLPVRGTPALATPARATPALATPARATPTPAVPAMPASDTGRTAFVAGCSAFAGALVFLLVQHKLARHALS